ncbi:hypothetical protein H7170_01650 [Candidatus Gracilibacteria bacterium]|nr:hypothetical protein [Candidatus Gracilibacteria bacterium]
MQKVLSILLVTSFTASVAFAASGDMVLSTPTTMTPTMASGSQAILPPPPPVTTTTPINTTQNNTLPQLTAAPSTSVAMSSSIGENKSVSCVSNAAFATNSCDACFDGGSVTTGKRLTGLFDNWTNTSTGLMIAYQSEQKNPNMVAFGTTIWTASPSDESKLWKSSSDIIWSPTQTGSTKMQYILGAGQKVKFFEADIAAGYTLTKTDRKNGELVGMMRYPTVAHAVDAVGNEGAAKTHYECVAYNLSAPATVVPVTPTTPVTPEITKTATGPAETIVLILAAFFIAFGLMFSLRKRI